MEAARSETMIFCDFEDYLKNLKIPGLESSKSSNNLQNYRKSGFRDVPPPRGAKRSETLSRSETMIFCDFEDYLKNLKIPGYIAKILKDM